MSDESTPLLTAAQRKLVGFALGFAAFCAIGWLIFAILSGAASFISAFSSVIWPLAVAGIMALVMRPVVTVFEHRLKIKRPFATLPRSAPGATRGDGTSSLYRHRRPRRN